MLTLVGNPRIVADDTSIEKYANKYVWKIININEKAYMKQIIVNIVISSVESLNQLLDKKVPIELGEATPLYGSSGVLDSLALVNLIVSVEEGIEDEFGVGIILANEKAISQRKSPFSTVFSLAEYIETLIKENSNHE